MGHLTAQRVTWIVAFVLAFALASTLVYRGSYAAFTAQTENTGNQWDTGTLALVDNDQGSAMFDTSALGLLIPGANGDSCIEVTKTGDLPQEVVLHATTGGGLADDLDLTITQGAGAAGFDDCTGFTEHDAAGDGGEIYSGKLGSMPSTFGTGLELDGNGDEAWTPAQNDSKVFRFEWSLPSSLANALQGQSATATFTWESQTPGS